MREGLLRQLARERGSVTIEFIGVLPLVFLIMLVCWQFLLGVYAVITAQAAAHEAAKVYAVTQDEAEASDAARKVIDAAGGGIGFSAASIHETGGGYFTAEVDVALELAVLPDIIKDNLDPEDKVISFSREIESRVVH